MLRIPAPTPVDTTPRRRWTGPLVGIGALCLASAGLALALGSHEGAWRRPPAAVEAEPFAGVSASLEAASPAADPAPPAAPPVTTTTPAEAPRPIVLRVEPPLEATAASARAMAFVAVPSAGAPGALPTAVAGAGGATGAAGAAGAPAAGASSVAADTGVPCGATVCAAGKVCCNASCGLCTNPGEACSKGLCGRPTFGQSVACGRNTCNVGELCCNTSCGICVRPGEECDSAKRCWGEVTYPQGYPESQSCGLQTCNVGLVCCNPSCGICAAPGEACTDRVCR
jgi:hypothetical protein